MLCFTVYFTRVNVTSVSVKQPFIWWRHSIDFQSFQNPNLFKHQTLREKQTACTKLSGDQSICLLCAFFHLKGGCGGILPNFWAAFTHPYVTPFTHPNAGVSMRVHRKHWTGHNNPGVSMRVHRKHWTGHNNPNQFDQSVNRG